MSTPHHKTKKIATLAPHKEKRCAGYGWDLGKLIFDKPSKHDSAIPTAVQEKELDKQV